MFVNLCTTSRKDYVKSIPIPATLETELEELVDNYEGDIDLLMKQLYDSGDVNLLLELEEKPLK